MQEETRVLREEMLMKVCSSKRFAVAHAPSMANGVTLVEEWEYFDLSCSSFKVT